MINKPKSHCFLFLVSIAGTTGMNMSVENNMLHLLCQQIKLKKLKSMGLPLLIGLAKDAAYYFLRSCLCLQSQLY